MTRVSIGPKADILGSNICCSGSLQIWQIIIEKIRLEGALEVSISTLYWGRKAHHHSGRITLLPIWVQSLVLQEVAGPIFSCPQPEVTDTNLRRSVAAASTKSCNLGQSSRGTEQVSLRSAKPGFQCTEIQAQDFSPCKSVDRPELPRGQLPSSKRLLELCLSEPPPGPMEWRSQGSIWPWTISNSSPAASTVGCVDY